MIRPVAPAVTAAAVALVTACTYGGAPLEDGPVPPPQGQYGYLEGAMPYDTPGMTEEEEAIIEGAGDAPAREADRRQTDPADPVLGPYDSPLFDRSQREDL